MVPLEVKTMEKTTARRGLPYGSLHWGTRDWGEVSREIPRNVQDPVPAGLSRTTVRGFADKVRTNLDLEPGAGMARAFARLGGRYEQLHTLYGFVSDGTDRAVIRALDDFTCHDPQYPEYAALEMAECLGTLFLHHPLVLRRFGPDAVTAVPRITPEGPAMDAMRERLWFACHLAMPEDAFRAAYAADPDPRALAKAFAVAPATASRRAKALGLEPADEPAPALG